MFTDVKRLRTFVTIAEEASFTGAAERLNMAQPWVSVQLRQLEDSLGLILVDRTRGSAAKLTREGREFFPLAKRVVDCCMEVTQEINAMLAKDEPMLIVGVDPITLYISERNKLIKDFMTSFPHIEISLISEPPCDLLSGLATGRFDMILTSCPTPTEEFEILPLYERELQLLVPHSATADYAHAARSGDLHNLRLLGLTGSYHPALFSWLSAKLEDCDIQNVVCPESSYLALIRYCSLMGIATLTPDFSDSISEMRTEMDLHRVRDRNLTISWALMRRKANATRASEKFWKLAAASRVLASAAAAQCRQATAELQPTF